MICGTRYGNVMASRGSVIPLFVEQMLAGKPITVTDPDMTRFMMTLDDAVDLVLYAFEHGDNGDIFVQKAPAATIEHAGPGAARAAGRPDHPVRVIGTRHGEKLYETLLSREEMAVRRGPGRLLPRAARRPRPELRASSSRRASDASQLTATTTTRTTPSASTCRDEASCCCKLDFMQRIARGEAGGSPED